VISSHIVILIERSEEESVTVYGYLPNIVIPPLQGSRYFTIGTQGYALGYCYIATSGQPDIYGPILALH